MERFKPEQFGLVIIDEAQAFRSFLEDFVVQILLPATLDYNGQIVLIGTPNPACQGYFFEASTGLVKDTDGSPMFSVHSWTGFDNPNIDRAYREGEHDDAALAKENASRAILQISARGGLQEGDPIFQREWLGKWVRDDSGLVYQVKPFNVIDEMPEADDWRYVLGMDVGFVDATAFVVMAYSLTLGACVVVESYQETEMLPTQQMAEVRRLEERYEFESVVIDPGGGGKGLVEELAQRHSVPAKVAAKRDKVTAIQTLNGDLRSNLCRVVKATNQELLHDLSLLQWNYAHLAKRGGPNWKMRPLDHLSIDDRSPDHLADAFLYAHRECLHYLNEYDVEGPSPGTPAWVALQEEELFTKTLEALEGEEAPWWEAPGVL
jgi:hypothetical protein